MMRSANFEKNASRTGGKSYKAIISNSNSDRCKFWRKSEIFWFFAKVFLKALYDRISRVLVGLPGFLVSTPVQSTRNPDHEAYGVMHFYWRIKELGAWFLNGEEEWKTGTVKIGCSCLLINEPSSQLAPEDQLIQWMFLNISQPQQKLYSCQGSKENHAYEEMELDLQCNWDSMYLQPNTSCI